MHPKTAENLEKLLYIEARSLEREKLQKHVFCLSKIFTTLTLNYCFWKPYRSLCCRFLKAKLFQNITQTPHSICLYKLQRPGIDVLVSIPDSIELPQGQRLPERIEKLHQKRYLVLYDQSSIYFILQNQLQTSNLCPGIYFRFHQSLSRPKAPRKKREASKTNDAYFLITNLPSTVWPTKKLTSTYLLWTEWYGFICIVCDPVWSCWMTFEMGWLCLTKTFACSIRQMIRRWRGSLEEAWKVKKDMIWDDKERNGAFRAWSSTMV